MRDLKDILNDIVTLDGYLGQLITNDPRLQAAYAARRREFEDNRAQKVAEYGAALQPTFAGLLLVNCTPGKARRFIEVARAELPVLVGEADALYNRISEGVLRSFGAEPTAERPLEFGAGQFRELAAHLRRISDEQRIRHNLEVGAGSLALMTSKQNVLNHVRKLVRAGNQDNINCAVLRSELLAQGLAAKMDDPVTAVVLSGVEPEEVEGLIKLFPRGSVVVNDLPGRDKVTKAEVMARFDKLKNTVKDNQTSKENAK